MIEKNTVILELNEYKELLEKERAYNKFLDSVLFLYEGKTIYKPSICTEDEVRISKSKLIEFLNVNNDIKIGIVNDI